MLMSPCLYFYVLLLLNQPMKLIRWRTLLHGLPLLPCVVFNVLFYYRPVDERVNWLIRDFYSGSMEMTIINVVLYLQIICYLMISLQAVSTQHKVSIYIERNGFRTNISWVRIFLFINIVFVLASLPICFLINNERTSIFIGQAAMDTDFIFLFVMAALKFSTADTEKIEEKKVSYQINEEQAASYWKMLTAYMETSKAYLDENCSLHSVAEDIGISQFQLSKILHTHGGISFADFINDYRLKEALIYLQDRSKQRKTIYTIAIECGFGSRSSFYRAFNKAYATTPATYRKQHNSHPEA
jgi:AraC-like DNA-binding protein